MPDKPSTSLVVQTEHFYDKRAQQFREAELPTKTVHIFARTKQGTAIDQPAGEVNMGSLAFSGSHYDFNPGSFSLRIIRRSVGYGSMASNGQLEWCLHHSRLGTVEKLTFRSHTNSPRVDHGDPMAPLYSFGPGTVTVRMRSLKGTHRISSSMEGIF